MEYRPLSRPEIHAIEAKVDTFFAKQALPGHSIGEVRWKVLTATEDSVRLLFAHYSKAWLDHSAFKDRAIFIHMVDRIKYNLRYYLELIDKSNLLDNLDNFSKFGSDGSEYTALIEIIHYNAALYASSVGTFTSIWGGHRVALGKDNGSSILLPCELREIQYKAVEALVAKHDDEFTPIPILAAAFAASSSAILPNGDLMEWGAAIKAIVKSTKVRNNSLTYQFVTRRAKDLFDDLYHEPSILPLTWKFPWSTAPESIRFSTALLSIAFYHVIAVYFGSGKHSLHGVGLNEVGLVVTPKELARRVVATADLPLEVTEKIISALTFGKGMKTPDPALQPLIPVGQHKIFVPCMMIVANHWSRNMMSLHARLEARSFDSQSEVFEKEMIDRILDYSVGREVLTNKTFSDGSWKEELDLIYVDQKNRSILACELKWSIPPGDPREVYNRRLAIDKKVTQASRKEQGLQRHLRKVLEQCGVRNTKGDWKIRSLVVTGGYSGHPSHTSYSIPIVPQAVFEKIISSPLKIDLAHDILCTPLWLPRPGIDFNLMAKSDKFGTVEMHDFGYFLRNEEYIDSNIIKYIADAAKYNASEFNSLGW